MKSNTSRTGKKIIIKILCNLLFIDIYLQFTIIKHEFSLCLIFFLPTCPKAKIRKFYLFIQTNSFIIFICPNPVLLVMGFRQVAPEWVIVKIVN